jgi:hypothetical protein
MTTTPRGADELVEAQAVPETTVNEQIRHTEAGACLFPVVDNDLTAPPGSCSDGANYIIASVATGAWASKEGQIATALGTNAANGWRYHTPVEGFMAYIQDENVLHYYNGSAWAAFASAGNPTESLVIACSDESTALTTGAAKVTFRMPYAFTLSAVRASVTTAPTDAALVVDINENTGGGATTILSTKITIDATEKTSTTAAAPVISDTALADDAEITIDIDQIGSTIAGAGLKVYLIGTRT